MAQGDLSGYKRGDVKAETMEAVCQFHADEVADIQELLAYFDDGYYDTTDSYDYDFV